MDITTEELGLSYGRLQTAIWKLPRFPFKEKK